MYNDTAPGNYELEGQRGLIEYATPQDWHLSHIVARLDIPFRDF